VHIILQLSSSILIEDRKEGRKEGMNESAARIGLAWLGLAWLAPFGFSYCPIPTPIISLEKTSCAWAGEKERGHTMNQHPLAHHEGWMNGK